MDILMKLTEDKKEELGKKLTAILSNLDKFCSDLCYQMEQYYFEEFGYNIYGSFDDSTTIIDTLILHVNNYFAIVKQVYKDNGSELTHDANLKMMTITKSLHSIKKQYQDVAPLQLNHHQYFAPSSFQNDNLESSIVANTLS